MRLEQLRLHNFRCFSEALIELDQTLTWVTGQNASGKTSLLEALFFLGHGRSFRSSRPERLIREGEVGFELVARLASGQGQSRVLGVGRRDGSTVARWDGQGLSSMVDAAKLLPVVILDAQMNQLVQGGPGERRRWLDWGVFHVEPGFLLAWRAYQQALKQRNMALKAGASERALAPWSGAVARTGETLAELRHRHFGRLEGFLSSYMAAALPEVEVETHYRRGWAQDETLEETLKRHVAKDREVGATRSGPHRADVQFRIQGVPAEERLSRGQQKMLAGALWLAQVRLFCDTTGQRPLLLVDDLAAELDGDNLNRFLDLLNLQSAQKVLTAVGDADIARTGLTEGRVFHVEHGILKAA